MEKNKIVKRTIKLKFLFFCLKGNEKCIGNNIEEI